MVGPVYPEKRLLWHPRQENKFVVGGGSQITLYEWAAEEQEILHITSQHDLQFMKVRRRPRPPNAHRPARVFRPSPGPQIPPSRTSSPWASVPGRVDLLRLEATRHTRRAPAGNSILSSGPIVSLTARNSRAVQYARLLPR
ncbi:hypothetical protein DFH09DRAFT_457276 [Mycena vulgaris]|nr:hypothetical protein DFH09DRAFT_457276 [Mycena vulgaris]